ncbi:DUF2000 domain-containing protein [Streptomyces armeniacus]|uniref:DUF2000 domain-containing protein n=1 Tax=Streptomyces armeniacus TaxID=83291 RepID=A0A345XR48_9ACTN|nr:DUF2000 domain-containing protein [Streptomyces armeniacus]AXK34114.1 DUF2000 domain-containing protein [Streptomyces armeniacus]
MSTANTPDAAYPLNGRNAPYTTDSTHRVAWDTKIAVVLREGLQDWQKLNVTSFVASGIAAGADGVMGEPYVDGDGTKYLPMFRQPVVVLSTDADRMRTIHQRAVRRGVVAAVYPESVFATNNDDANRATIADVATDDLVLAGIAVYGDKREVDKVVKGASMHP